MFGSIEHNNRKVERNKACDRNRKRDYEDIEENEYSYLKGCKIFTTT